MDYMNAPRGNLFDPGKNDVAEKLLWQFAESIVDRYSELLPTEEERDRFCTTGKMMIRRGGSTEVVHCDGFALSDVPDILATLVEMEAASKEAERQEAERKTEERKKVNRIRAKERRRLRKLGEWSEA